MAMKRLDELPEDCISAILALTSPSDAFRLSLVSSILRSAADSDFLWNGFLPSDCKEILAKSITPFNFSSKRELFVRLCKSILIDEGKKSFALEKSSGLKSYMLSAKELSIQYGDEPEHWTWKSIPQSRFAEVAELNMICRLEIEGKLRTEILSPNTKYGAYLVMKISDCAFGLDSRPCEMSVKVGHRETTTSFAYLQTPESMEERRYSRDRGDGWMEVELGEFFNGGGEDDEEISMSLREVKGCHVKGGLIVQGIEIRPKFGLLW